MRILHVIADLERERGGPAQACVELAQLTARRGHDVRILTSDRGLAPEYRAEAKSSHSRSGVSVEAFPLDAPAFWGTSWQLRQRLATAIPEADIVHLHSLYLFHDWVTGAYCRRFAKPYIVRPHGTLDPYIYRRHRARKRVMELLFQNDVLKHAAGLHYTTQEEQTLALPHAHNPRGWVVPNGIDLTAFDNLPPPDRLRLRYPQIGGRRVVLFFGRLNFKKGVDTTIHAFAQAARARSDIVLLMAGPDGGQRAAAERWAAEAGLGDRVVFTGMVSGEDKPTVLGGSSVFLLPSLSENFGISVVEAAAAGIPVIISDRVNLWRDFSDAEAGLVAPPTVEAFAQQLEYVLDHPAEATAMALRGKALAHAKFGWDGLGDQYEAMYREAAGRPAA